MLPLWLTEFSSIDHKQMAYNVETCWKDLFLFINRHFDEVQRSSWRFWVWSLIYSMEMTGTRLKLCICHCRYTRQGAEFQWQSPTAAAVQFTSSKNGAYGCSWWKFRQQEAGRGFAELRFSGVCRSLVIHSKLLFMFIVGNRCLKPGVKTVRRVK